MQIRKKTKLNSEAAGFQSFQDSYQQIFNWPEEEWKNFVSCIDQDLPITFSFDQSKSYYQKIYNNVKKNYPLFIERLPNTFELVLSKLELRKNEENKIYKIFLEQHQLLNSIFRQELVSMLPVFLLEIKKNDKILDMCAAPGSKSLQIINILKKNQSQENFLLINELDKKRVALLANQTMKTLYPNVAIISEDARKIQGISFSKIICDVPCAGDGTLRKNGIIIKNWQQRYAQNMQQVQIGILLNGLYLLQEKGELIYSTCSLSPIENEAVVQFALDILSKFVQLVDFNIEGIKLRNGLCDWKIWVKQGQKSGFYNQQNKQMPSIYKDSFFPNIQHAQLCYTKRVLPHDNNTGGFFMAKFVKKQNFDFKLIEQYLELNNQEEVIEEELTQQNIKIQLKQMEKSESQHIFLPSLDFYGIDQKNKKDFYISFAKHLDENSSKRVFFFPLSGVLNKLAKFDIIHAGVQIFKQDRSNNDNLLRLTYEGSVTLKNEITKQKLMVQDQNDFFEILNKCPIKLEENDRWSIFKHGTIIIQHAQSEAVFTLWKGIGQISLLLSKEEQTQINYYLDNL